MGEMIAYRIDGHIACTECVTEEEEFDAVSGKGKGARIGNDGSGGLALS